jgi:hypothetical protein
MTIRTNNPGVKKGFYVILGTLFLFAATILPVIAFQLENIDVTSAGPGGTVQYPVVLDEAPAGLAGYTITIQLSSPGVGEITGVTYPAWAVLNETGSNPSDSVVLRAVDLPGGISAAATSVTLATLTLRADAAGTTPVTITINRMDDDNGDVMEPATPAGSFTVTATRAAAGIGIWRDSTHRFYRDYTRNGVWNGASVDRIDNFGITGDIPLTGDWNNDGITEIGVFRPTTHLFYHDYNGNGVWNGAITDRQYYFGITGDLPFTGDWNNDGIAEIGVFRPSTHLFYLDFSGNGIWDGALTDRLFNFGIPGDKPVSGDWNGDGMAEIGIFRPSTHSFYLDYNGNGVWNGAVIDRSNNFGITGDIPITGDWNADGKTNIGIFRPSANMFYLDFNGNGVWNGAMADLRYNFGVSGDTPVAGEWDH